MFAMTVIHECNNACLRTSTYVCFTPGRNILRRLRVGRMNMSMGFDVAPKKPKMIETSLATTASTVDNTISTIDMANRFRLLEACDELNFEMCESKFWSG